MGNDRGFSLIEVLVGLFILAIIGSAGTTIMMSSVDSRDALKAATDRSELIAGVHARIRDDLAQWVPRSAISRPGLDQQSAFLGGGINDSALLFAFVRDGWANPGMEVARSGLIGVRYELYNRQLIRKIMLRPDGTNTTATIEDVLLTDIDKADVEFWQGTQWVTQWRSSEGSPIGGPEAVRVRLTLKNNQNFEWLFLTSSGGLG